MFDLVVGHVHVASKSTFEIAPEKTPGRGRLPYRACRINDAARSVR